MSETALHTLCGSHSHSQNGVRNSSDFVVYGCSSLPDQGVLDTRELVHLQSKEAPPDASNEKLLVEIFNVVREYTTAEIAKNNKTKVFKAPLTSTPILVLSADSYSHSVQSSMSDLTSTESQSFFDHTDIRHNPNEHLAIKPNYPKLRDAAEAQGIDSVTFKKGIDATDLTAPGISLQKEDAENLEETLEYTRTAKYSEAVMRDRLWDSLIFKKPTQDWWNMDVRVERFPEYRMQTIKHLDTASTASITTEKGRKRGQKSINPPGTVTRFPSRIFAPAQVSVPLKSIPNIQLPKMNLYIKFDSLYLLLDRLFLRDKDRESIFNLPVARLFWNPDNDDFHCCPYLLIEIKSYPDPASYLYTMEKAVNYLTLHASTILYEWLKLLWLSSGAHEFEVRKDLEIHMFAAVGHTVRHLFCRIRPPKPDDRGRVRYEAVKRQDYDLTIDHDRSGFNTMHQSIQACSHFYGNMYKEAICKALQSGISPDTTDSNDIYFAYSQRDGKRFYMMKRGDPGMCVTMSRTAFWTRLVIK